MIGYLLLICTIPAQSDALFNIIGNTQSMSVQGRLLCQGSPASNVLVKLYDDDMTFDSKLGSMRTDNNGVFQVNGTITDITTADPKLNIYHRCNYIGLCDRKLSMDIPQQYISSGSTASQVYDIGTINLANQFKGETTDCVH